MRRWESECHSKVVGTIDMPVADVPADIKAWLSELRLLYGVPLSHLVGDELLLPPESVRFFYLNENWVNVLMNGALSIGRATTKAATIDGRCFEQFRLASIEGLRSVRYNRMHPNHRRPLKAALEPGDVLTGFLMRSVLCQRWKGLEMYAFDRNDVALDILRAELLSPDLLICLFDGELKRIIVAEPKEGLRFGTPDNERIFKVRSITPGEEGTPTGATVTAQVNESGRVDIKRLAADLSAQLKAPDFSSAEMALELMLVPSRAEFIREQEEVSC